eukprot:CAMPEP_0184498768 /NCGR_PEP_ID=MMETSP0113_2-20130426/39781_1 /TAXON_ID=91329 /ORGANISM="Norrisiella sphaerica, Strain BC52" /LENGTH=611 /DNA_ID=CAMNT_0026886415 /DNA_START=29 /DNA_END=1864 /DNA_ORIENTATION=-
MNHFQVAGNKIDTRDFFTSADRNNCMCAIPFLAEDPKSMVLALACEDRYIRIVDGAKMIAHPKIPGAVTTVTLQEFVDRDAEQPIAKLLYGTETSLVGQLFIRQGGAIKPGWVIKNQDTRSGVSAIDSIDVLKDGVPDTVVARKDGAVEVYSVDSSGPKLKYSHQLCHETITGLAHGNIVSMHTDILVSTYSGRLLALTYAEGAGNAALPRPRSSRDSKGAGGRKRESKAGERKMSTEEKELISDIEKLEKEIDSMKEKFRASSRNAIATKKQFNVIHSMRLDEEDACCTLSIEIELPIEMVVLHSDVPLIPMDMDADEAIISQTAPDRKERNAVLATYTCVHDTTRISIRFRTIEGQFGTISAYVIPKTSPKTSQRIQLPVKPLSLHAKMDFADAVQLQDGIPVNTLNIVGDFSLAQVHGWVSTVLPGVPGRVSSDRVEMGYRSCFCDSILTCHYVKGKATFVSDSVTTITIVKEIVSREATKRQARIEIQLDVKKQSVFHMLKMLRPKLDHYFSINRKSRLLAALKEIKSHEEDVSFMSQEYQAILANGAKLNEEIKKAPQHLDFLKGIVMDLYVDKCKLLTGAMPKDSDVIEKALENYAFDSLLAAFK